MATSCHFVILPLYYFTVEIFQKIIFPLKTNKLLLVSYLKKKKQGFCQNCVLSIIIHYIHTFVYEKELENTFLYFAFTVQPKYVEVHSNQTSCLHFTEAMLKLHYHKYGLRNPDTKWDIKKCKKRSSDHRFTLFQLLKYYSPMTAEKKENTF